MGNLNWRFARTSANPQIKFSANISCHTVSEHKPEVSNTLSKLAVTVPFIRVYNQYSNNQVLILTLGLCRFLSPPT